jgi:sigma-B regulation protein RsbU (phosphoserine phosphatase)
MPVLEQTENEQGKLKTALFSVRRLLRRVMPRVAIVAVVMLFVRLFISNTSLYRETFVGELFGFLTFCAVALTCLYYGFKALRWLKRKLLWRVRRRLVITYLFVGLTPILLLSLLGLLFTFGGSAQGIARIITAQVNATEKETEASARSLLDSFQRLPANADDRAIQAWLDERVALVRASLPGARAALWRGASADDLANLGQGNQAQFLSDVNDEKARGVGDETVALNAPLPDWMRGRAEWSGLSFTKSNDKDDSFGSPSVRAIVRSMVNNRPVTLLLIVPVSRALVEQYREATGIYIRPFFVKSGTNEGSNRVEITTGGKNGQRRGTLNPNLSTALNNENEIEKLFRQDQFGEQTSADFYIVVLPATDWMTGETSQHLSFIFDWSWALASKQFWGTSAPGAFWRDALKYVAIIFLVFELLALIAAIWMTRAVTGTVHRLYSALDFIKRGDFSHRVKVRSHDQLGELATAFNDMSGNIEVLLQERVERERLEREVEIAAQVQAQLFPRTVPTLQTAQISAECRAARGVAGDYYDYIEIAPGLVALALGDVSGKGISASLVMSNLQASLRAQTTITSGELNVTERATAVSVEAGGDVGLKLRTPVVADVLIDGIVARQMTNINRQLCQSTESNRFATLFLAIYDDDARKLHYTNAGHNAPILIRADGTVERLTIGGMLAGAFEWAKYEEAATALQSGDLLLIFSDGISEAENDEGLEYGERKLTQFAVEHRHLNADEIRNAIFEEIETWSGKRERDDDQTLVIVKLET